MTTKLTQAQIHALGVQAIDYVKDRFPVDPKLELPEHLQVGWDYVHETRPDIIEAARDIFESNARLVLSNLLKTQLLPGYKLMYWLESGEEEVKAATTGMANDSEVELLTGYERLNRLHGLVRSVKELRTRELVGFLEGMLDSVIWENTYQIIFTYEVSTPTELLGVIDTRMQDIDSQELYYMRRYIERRVPEFEQ